ncbi:MAG: hypothetical protein ACRDTH_25140 [Pseudonocardiaceae bacterium]
MKGEHDDFAWLRPWQTRIRYVTQAGKTVRRVRVMLSVSRSPTTSHGSTPTWYSTWKYSTWKLAKIPVDCLATLLPSEIIFPVDGKTGGFLMID